MKWVTEGIVAQWQGRRSSAATAVVRIPPWAALYSSLSFYINGYCENLEICSERLGKRTYDLSIFADCLYH